MQNLIPCMTCIILCIINIALQAYVKLSKSKRFFRFVFSHNKHHSTHTSTLVLRPLLPSASMQWARRVIQAIQCYINYCRARALFSAICLWQGYVKFTYNIVVKGLAGDVVGVGGGQGGNRFGAVLGLCLQPKAHSHLDNVCCN